MRATLARRVLPAARAVGLATVVVAAMLVGPGMAAEPADHPASHSVKDRSGSHVAKPNGRTVRVAVFDGQGKLRGPVDSPLLRLKPAEWRQRLSAEQFRVLRSHATETAYCGGLLDNKKRGVYTCAGCELPLFSSDAKFESQTGWPSFLQPIAQENIDTRADLSDGTLRLETHCVRCQGHLGHIFPDGPPPGGLRFCINSAALVFTPHDQLAKLADPATGEASLPEK